MGILLSEKSKTQIENIPFLNWAKETKNKESNKVDYLQGSKEEQGGKYMGDENGVGGLGNGSDSSLSIFLSHVIVYIPKTNKQILNVELQLVNCLFFCHGTG